MLGKNSKNKEENTSSFESTTVTDTSSSTTTEQQQQAATINKLQAENEALKKLTPKNSDDIAPGIRKTQTFEAQYRNGYEDGTVARAIKADKEKQSAEMQVET